MEREKLIALVGSVQRGDPEAAGQLYESFYSDVYYFILKTVKDPTLSEDLTQDTFMTILQNIRTLQEPAAFITWSRQVAYHKCTDHLKKKHELLADENEDGTTPFDNMAEDREEFIPDEALDRKELRQTLMAMVDSLPAEQRTAILMRYFEELSVADIARVQGVSEGTVKSRLNYGRKTLKTSVENWELRSGVKLRCAGVIPLLLWLAAMGRIAARAAGAGTAAAGATAAGTAVGAAAGATGGAVKTAAAKAGMTLVQKLVAGIVAAALALGGTAAALNAREKKEEPPMEWVGYGEAPLYHAKRYELELDTLTDRKIGGHLEVSSLYETVYSTDFTGTGVAENDDTVVYTVTAREGYAPTVGDPIHEWTLRYSKQADTFTFDGFVLDGILPRITDANKKLLGRSVWEGTGEDSLSSHYSDVDFRINLEELREQTVKGHILVKYADQVKHDTGFTGRGYLRSGVYYYELKLDTVRFEHNILDHTVDAFWIAYDPGKELLQILPFGYYEADLERTE